MYVFRPQIYAVFYTCARACPPNISSTPSTLAAKLGSIQYITLPYNYKSNKLMKEGLGTQGLNCTCWFFKL